MPILTIIFTLSPNTAESIYSMIKSERSLTNSPIMRRAHAPSPAAPLSQAERLSAVQSAKVWSPSTLVFAIKASRVKKEVAPRCQKGVAKLTNSTCTGVSKILGSKVLCALF